MLHNNRTWTLYNIGCIGTKKSTTISQFKLQIAQPLLNLKWIIQWELYLSAPPIASTISLQSFIGGGNGLGSRPRIKPKSTWKRPPSFLRRRLSKCLPKKKKTHSKYGQNINSMNNLTFLQSTCVLGSIWKIGFEWNCFCKIDFG